MENKKEVLGKKLGIGVTAPIQSDNPQVEMTRMKLEAIEKLSDKDIEVFSSHVQNRFVDETTEFSRCALFAVNPLPALERRLAMRGVTRAVKKVFDDVEIETQEPVRFGVPVVEKYLEEVLHRRHSSNRKRVQEYLDGIRNIGRTDTQEIVSQRQGLLSRIG